MEINYLLTIDCNSQQIEKITQVLNKEPSRVKSGSWELLLEEKESDPPVDFVGIFLNLLDNKYDQFLEIGIQRKHITIWMLYEYEEQCNIELIPDDIKRLGENGISLCISCWETSS